MRPQTLRRSGGPARARVPRLRPERRGRGDVVAAVVLILLLVAGGTLLWGTSAVVSTTSEPSTVPITAAPAAAGVPDGFVEAWRAPSGATAGPVVAGPAVVTADGSTVLGRDAVSGAVGWTYGRDLPLCTVAAGFPSADSGTGRVLALYDGGTGFCSELTALRPDTGVRAATSNPDPRPGTRLLANGPFVLATGTHALEVVRSDLVRTLEYGAVTTSVQLGRQPRPGCTYGSVALATGRVGVLERCPGEALDRLSVLAPDGSDGAETPQEEFSVALPAAGATLVALSADRAAVALPGPPRLQLLDRAGLQVGLIPLDVPDADLAGDPPGGVAVTSSDEDTVYWWTGSRTIALDGTDLAPRWTVEDALGPAVPYGGDLLVPVPAGYLQVDAERGTALRTLAVSRPDPTAPVLATTAGAMVLEQRGPDVVALRPVP